MSSVARRLQQIQSTLNTKTDQWERLLILPDDCEVRISEASSGSASRILAIQDSQIIKFCVLEQRQALVLSAIGTPYESDNPTPKYPVLELSSPSTTGEKISVADLWGCIYALWTVFHVQEHIPIILSSTIGNVAELTEYLLYSGLGRRRLGVESPHQLALEIFLSRAAFWQAAGSTAEWHERGWLPGKYALMTSNFPTVQSFTRNPLVITSHPHRPPKPPPGSCIYKRFCTPVNKMLSFHMIDLNNNLHMETFHRWHNDERVHSGWGERGSMEYHREYVKKQLADPHVLPLLLSWDGDLMGYIEVTWIKEDHVAAYVPGGAHDYDRGVHVLVGEEKYRGSTYAKCWMLSYNHYVFLADPRTERMIGEPKQENGAVIKISVDAGMHVETFFDFPYKRSAMTMNKRERWFKADRLL